jgi:hypothetical protein
MPRAESDGGGTSSNENSSKDNSKDNSDSKGRTPERPPNAVLSIDQIRAALADSGREPHGKSRIHRAESLLDAADRHSDTETQFRALAETVEAYQFGGEGFRSPVPFSRMLRLWDASGSGFDDAGQAAHTVHWMFKWLTSDLLLIPEVPLATVDTFVEEMDRRYRLAGYSPRPVEQERFHIADHLGAADDASRHLERWRAADRDRMSNCEACEQLIFGEWHAGRGDDSAALSQWASTLAGELRCAEEPARTLAGSLLPLLRLGRFDEARANHLRGYRLVRGKDNLRSRVAQHIEFCACTGNEGRGLELLAAHRTWFDSPGGAYAQLSFHAAVALLLRRVVERGSPDLPVPGPGGRDWAADELYLFLRDETRAAAARFDARNGTGAVSGRVADRIARQPLVDGLPLGVRSVPPWSGGQADRLRRSRSRLERPGRTERLPQGATDAVVPDPSTVGVDPETLAAEAGRLFRLGHPDSAALWERAAGVADAHGVDLDPVSKAELCEQRAATAHDEEDVAEATRYTTEAVAYYEAAGLPGRATALHAQLVIYQAQTAVPPRRTDLALLDAVYADVRRMYDRGVADALDLLTVRFGQAIDAREALKDPGPDWDADLERYEITALAFLSDAERFTVPHRLGTGHFMLSEVALHREDPDTALAELAAAVDFHEAAGRPWSTAHPRMAMAQTSVMLGRLAEAEAAAHAALELAARWPRMEFATGYARQLLANVSNMQSRFEDSARHALDAAGWADRVGDAELAAGSRYTLAYAYEQLDRPADAAAVLESAMPELVEQLAPPTVVEARWILGRSLSRLGDHRGAAEHFLLAARLAETFEQQGSYAQLAAAAGHALKSAGLPGEARQAFAKAVEVLRGIDDPLNLAKTLRALAWTVFEEADVRLDDGEPPAESDDEVMVAQERALDQALLCFADAEQLLEAAAAVSAAAASADQTVGGRDHEGDHESASGRAGDRAIDRASELGASSNGGAPGDRPLRGADLALEIAFEIAETQDQLARLHLNADLAEKALPYAERAAAGFRQLLPARALDYDFSEQMIAWLLDRFLTREAALGRLDKAIVVCEAAGVDAPRCVAYRKQLREG